MLPVSAGGDQVELETATRPCPVCGKAADACEVLYEERFDPARLDRFAFAARKVPELMHWRLVECPVCDVLFASPAPDPAGLAAAYRGAGYDSGEEARYAAETYGELLREVVPRLPAVGRVLDVGAGNGAFLRVLRERGFGDLIGVEPSRAAIEAGDADTRPLTREGVFQPGDFDLGGFRMVSVLHLVEHLSDPLAALGHVHGLLRPGGALFVVCHDRRAPLNWLLGRRSAIYDLEHLQLFGRRSLRALLERVGFEKVEIRRFPNRYPMRYWLRLAPLGRAKTALIAVLDRAGLGSLPLTLPVGNLAAVAWKEASA